MAHRTEVHLLVSINYSYSTEASYTQILGETKRALTWLKDNANNLGIDPARIVVAGDSAGGHLAAFLATSAGTYDLGATGDTSVAAALSIYGPHDFLLEEYTDSCGLEVELLYEFLDCNPNGALPSLACDADDLIASSPATYIDASDPPMMLVHGQQDCVVPWEQSAHMANLLEQAGVPVNLQLTPTGEHDVDTLSTSALDMARWIADQNGCPVP
jgi:acetyl esterase/lipase